MHIPKCTRCKFSIFKIMALGILLGAFMLPVRFVFAQSESQCPEHEEVNCIREDRTKVEMGEYRCMTVTGQELCWKSGPYRRDDLKDGTPIPHYYELTEDYEIPITDYFEDPPPVPLFEDDDGSKREVLYELSHRLVHGNTDYLTIKYKWDFFNFDGHYFTGGDLLIKKGYRWDGASRGVSSEYFVRRSFMTHCMT